jgi:hypothetical protein
MPDAVWREIDGRVVIISLEDGRIRTLNPTAAALWTDLDDRPIAALVARLSEQFPSRPEAELRADVEAFVEDLVGRGMATVTAGAPR